MTQVLFFSIADLSTLFGNCSDGQLRLVGGANSSLGRVEVCVNNAWGTVCNSKFGTNEARVICRQLGYSGNGKVTQVLFLA